MTSLAASFVHAIIPRRLDDNEQSRLFKAVGIDPQRCVYCGDPATDMDHFRGLVKGGRPSGHFHTSDNVVPSCGPCNQSKGGAEWRKWLTGNARRSPSRREISDLEDRIERLSRFEKEAQPFSNPESFEKLVGAELWEPYWDKLEQIGRILVEAEKDAEIIRSKLEAAATSSEASDPGG